MTILELLVVIAIVTAITSLVFPAIQSARERTRNAQCLNNLHQTADALHLYYAAHRILPAGWQPEESDKSSYGWAACILNEMGQSSLSSNIDRSEPVDKVDQLVRSTTPATLLCPSDLAETTFPLYKEVGSHGLRAQDSSEILSTLPCSNYVGIFGNTDPDDAPGESGAGMFIEAKGRRFSEVTRGLSMAALISERTFRKLPSSWLGTLTAGEDSVGRVVGFLYLGPNRSDSDECELDSRHPGHVNFAWADGHVASVADDIDQKVYRQSAEIQ